MNISGSDFLLEFVLGLSKVQFICEQYSVAMGIEQNQNCPIYLLISKMPGIHNIPTSNLK